MFALFTFSLVKKIGEGSYLSDDPFIIERARKEKALNVHNLRFNNSRNEGRIFGKQGRTRAS